MINLEYYQAPSLAFTNFEHNFVVMSDVMLFSGSHFEKVSHLYNEKDDAKL